MAANLVAQAQNVIFGLKGVFVKFIGIKGEFALENRVFPPRAGPWFKLKGSVHPKQMQQMLQQQLQLQLQLTLLWIRPEEAERKKRGGVKEN